MKTAFQLSVRTTEEKKQKKTTITALVHCIQLCAVCSESSQHIICLFAARTMYKQIFTVNSRLHS